jgi:ABC transporter family protein
MIEAVDLTKRYGAKLAVGHLSFTVEPGRVTGFLGPNGAGKSTTMRMIPGLDRPDAGRATIAGRPYRDLPRPLREVGALLEAKAVHSGRSAYNHLLCLAQTQGLPRRRVREVIELVGLEEVARKRAAGMIRASLLAVPRRTPMLAAKAAAFAAVVFVVAELVALSSFFLGQAMLRPHVAIAIGDPGVPRAILGLGLYLSVIGLFAMAIDAIVRHVAGAIAVTLGFLVVLSPLASLLPGSLGEHVNAYLPGNAGQLIMSSGRDPSQL